MVVTNGSSEPYWSCSPDCCSGCGRRAVRELLARCRRPPQPKRLRRARRCLVTDLPPEKWTPHVCRGTRLFACTLGSDASSAPNKRPRRSALCTRPATCRTCPRTGPDRDGAAQLVKQAGIDAGGGTTGALTSVKKLESQKLRREVRALKMERDFRKRRGLLRQGPSSVFELIEAEKAGNGGSSEPVAQFAARPSRRFGGLWITRGAILEGQQTECVGHDHER